MQYQTHFTRGQPDDEAIKLIQYYEPLALEYDPRGYCVATSEGNHYRNHTKVRINECQTDMNY